MTDKKKKIYNLGKELFKSNGFKDTNVSQITKKAGIATGTFYNYYSSKDELFMDIYVEENTKLKNMIMDSLDLEADPISVMKEMIILNTNGMRSNPILKEWYNKEVYNKIEEKFREAKGIDKVDFLYGRFIEIVKKWQAKGKIRKDIEGEMVMAIFSALINIDTHKEEIGLQYFPQVLEYLTEFTMKGLIDCSNKE